MELLSSHRGTGLGEMKTDAESIMETLDITRTLLKPKKQKKTHHDQKHRDSMDKDLYGGEHHAKNKWFINPNGSFRRMWDFLTTVWVLYLIATVPLQIAFPDNVMKEPFWKGFGVFLDTFFWIDIALNFRTGFEHAGHVDYKQWHIIDHYLGLHSPLRYIPTGWFVIDIFASIPFELFVQTQKKVRKTVKLWKIFKLTKLLRMGRLLRKMPDYFKYRMVFYAAFLLLVSGHMLCCLWIGLAGLGITSNDRPVGFDTESLLKDNHITVGQAYAASLDGIIKQLFLLSDAQVMSGFFSNHTTAEGQEVWEENTGSSTYTHWLSIFVSLIGGGIQSLIFALVFKLVTNQSSMRERFQSKMNRITEEMHSLHLPEDLQKKIVIYYRLLWGQPNFYGNEINKFISTDMDLSYPLKMELSNHLSSLIPGLKLTKICSECSDECIGVLINKMRSHYFTCGSFIWKPETIIRNLIYVFRGEVLELEIENYEAIITNNSVKEDNIEKKAPLKSHIFYGEEDVLQMADVNFGKYLIAHSPIVNIAVFPRRVLFHVLRDFQSLPKQLAHCSRSPRSPMEIVPNPERQSSLTAITPLSASPAFQNQEEGLIEIQYEGKSKITLDTLSNRVERLETTTTGMNDKLDKIIRFLGEMRLKRKCF